MKASVRVTPLYGWNAGALGGGHFDERCRSYIDSHSESIPDEVWSLYEETPALPGNSTPS